jgi:hypothetical protein
MGVRWWGSARDVILKGIVACGEWRGEVRWVGGSVRVRERVFFNTPTGSGQTTFTESAEEERGKAGGQRQSCERTMGNGSRDITDCQ